MSSRRALMSVFHCHTTQPPTLPKTEIVRDAEGTKVVPRKTPTLIERLIARSAGQTLPAPKRGRGRPRKGGAV